MEKPYLQLSYTQVGLSAVLILINGAISIFLKLGLERRLLLAAFATVAQLLLIGFALDWVFRLNRWYLVLALMVAMTLIAGTAAIQRTHLRYPGIWPCSIISVWASSWAMNSMMVVSIVSLPGMMTGQILAGASPLEAVKYQIVIMFLIASAC
jgi:putative ABC transport system permease protein